MTSDSETLRLPPRPSEIGPETEELLTDFSDVQNSDKTSILTRVAATLATTKSECERYSKEERTEKARIKVSQLAKEYLKVFMSIGFLFRVFLFLAVIGIHILVSVKYIEMSKNIVHTYGDIPTCVFQWAEWSECSASCSMPNQTATRSRRIIPETVIDMRGLKSDSSLGSIMINIWSSLLRSDCYDIRQISNCNLYECPVNLSTLTDFTECHYVNTSPNNEECDYCRKLPPRGLIRIDTVLPSSKPCNCTDARYPI